MSLAEDLRQRARSERGAILIQVGIALMVLVGFSAFVADYGSFWLARRQAQNAADAGALAGAIARVFDEQNTSGSMLAGAMDAATANALIVGAPGTVVVNDYPCPGWVTTLGPCVDVRVFRDSGHGNALPTYFANVFGLTGQDVQAMAVAQASAVNGARCLKPWMAPNMYTALDIGPTLLIVDPLMGFWVADFPATSDCGVTAVTTSASDGSGDTLTGNAAFTIDPAVVTAIVDQDPGASWNGSRIVGSCAPGSCGCRGGTGLACANGLNGRISPRVVPIGLFELPVPPASAAGSTFPILDFAGLFVLSPSDPLCPTTAAVCGYLVAFPGVLARKPVVSSAALNVAPRLIQ